MDRQNLFNRVSFIIGIIFIVWLAASFLEVVTHNTLDYVDYVYRPWNFFRLIVSVVKGR